ncbi:MAG: hypothetical protein R3F42_12015 [Pseudomonadota bacterium]
MAFIRNRRIEPEILTSTRCERGFACLSTDAACNVEPFEDRDVQLLRCRDDKACAYRRQYRDRFICTCPVNRASFGLN